MNMIKKWNWQKDDWPKFIYDKDKFQTLELKFMKQAGLLSGVLKHTQTNDQKSLMIDMLRDEALNTSEIEGEFLNRESLQSSIMKHFGLKVPHSRHHPAENGIAEMMYDLYTNYQTPLTHDILFEWHRMLMNGRRDLQQIGAYRTHKEPMQIVSGALSKPKVHFEAPPSQRILKEMEQFIQFFNASSPEGSAPLSPLIRASILHMYFESIHPFEDGNGRLGRALVEKALAQNLKRPTLIALSLTINGKKKNYYDALSKQSVSNELTPWITYFAPLILKAQDYTIAQIEFMIQKTRFFDHYATRLNDRQTKVLKRMLQEGPKGFEGGLSAKNYITIADTSPSTATRDLQELVELKVLKQSGERKGTRYHLSMRVY